MLLFLKRHALLGLAFALAFLLTLFFLVRLVVSTIVWSDPANLDQPIAGWMTPRYVVNSWQVTPEIVGAALGLEGVAAGRMITLEEIAARQGRPLEAVVSDLEAAIAAARSGSDG